MFLETMQSHWGFICLRRLFLTFGNLTSISIDTRTFEITINKKRREDENCFETKFRNI